MRLAAAMVALLTMLLLSSCSSKPSAEAPAADATPPAETAPAPEVLSGPRAVVHLKNGNRVPGSIVASTRTEMVILGDDGIETKVPLGQVKSVEYGEASTTSAAARPRTSAPARSAAPAAPAKQTPSPTPEPARAEEKAAAAPPTQPERELTPAPPPPRPVTTKTYELPAGSQISVRTNEPIDSSTAAEGQTFDAQVTRDATDANGDVVIPRGSDARIVIRSASRGGRIKGASDLVLDLESVTINGKRHEINTVDVTKQGKSGVGTNRRTAEHVGGGAALGAIIGAIAGGGKGAAIGAGAGAGAGALAQILTKGRTIKVPVESVLTFSLDQSLKVAQVN